MFNDFWVRLITDNLPKLRETFIIKDQVKGVSTQKGDVEHVFKENQKRKTDYTLVWLQK